MKKREHLENTAEQEALAAQLGESDTFIDKMKRMAADNKLAVFSAFVILFFLLLAVCAPLLTPYSFEGFPHRLQSICSVRTSSDVTF